MKLPEAFIERIKKQRPLDYKQLLESFNLETFQGLRVNTLKISVESFLEKFPFTLQPVPWTGDGFYYSDEDAVTKHPYFHAGLYYIQEPSAMSPVGTLTLNRGEKCLDLCAAPGGKSLQMATGIQDRGLLVTNDINDKRVKAIVRNIERFGLRNVIVLNESPNRIRQHFGAFFDEVLVDAPCSGEGMFRKDPKAIGAWAVYENDRCAEMQRDILKSVQGLLTYQGRLTYSTCTFAPEENELQMLEFQREYPYFEKDFQSNSLEATGIEVNEHEMKLLPHKVKGEGHYIARFKCTLDLETGVIFKEDETTSKTPPSVLAEFMQEHLTDPLEGRFKMIKEKVHLMPEVVVPTKGLKVAREGVYLGDIKGQNFMPSQAFALYVNPNHFKNKIDFSSDSIEIVKYLKCETLYVDHEGKGLHLVTTDGFPVGFCKLQNGMLKNLYPASWRMF